MSSSRKPSGPTSRQKRVFLWIDDVFSNRRGDFASWQDYRSTFWEEVHRLLQHQHGEFVLSGHPQLSPAEDAIEFLASCNPESFLDFLEYIFRVHCFFHVRMDTDLVIEELNRLLSIENLPYHMTALVEREVVAEANEPSSLGGGGRYIETVAYPKIVMRENEVTHQQAIGPTLTILERTCFHQANLEFLAALEDYRKGDLGDCLTKCVSAFESAMKVICQENRWHFEPTDTAAKLVRRILPNTDLEPFLEQHLVAAATVRNKLGSAHGGGSDPRTVSRHVARYALNLTASSILLLAEEVGLG